MRGHSGKSPRSMEMFLPGTNPPHHGFVLHLVRKDLNLHPSCLLSHHLSADPPRILGLPGIMWSVRGHLSPEQICAGKETKRKRSPANLHPRSVSQQCVCPLRVRYKVLLGLLPLKNTLESASEPSTVDFNTISTAPTSHDSEGLKPKQAKPPQ